MDPEGLRRIQKGLKVYFTISKYLMILMMMK